MNLCRYANYRRILVYIFCLIIIGLSLSDEANKMKFLNIERAEQFLDCKTVVFFAQNQ